MLKRNRGKYASGSALVYGLVIMFAVSIILSAIIGFIVSQTKYGFQVASRESSLQIAEAGTSFYRWYLSHMVEGKTAGQIQDFWETGNPLGVDTAYESEYFDPGGAAVGKYRVSVAPPSSGSTVVTVTSTGWTYKYPDVKRMIRVRLRRPSWSENAVIANDVMRFGSGTAVSGKIHSNQGIRFDGIARNLVTSSMASYDDPDHTGGNEFGVHTHVNAPPGAGINNTFRTAEAPSGAVTTPPARTDVFQAGRVLPVPTVDFTGVLADLNVIKTEAQTGSGKYFDGIGVGRHIILKTNGTYDVCTASTMNVATNAITGYEGSIAEATGGSASNNGNACITTTACALGNFTWVQSSNHSKGKCVVAMSNYAIPNNSVIFTENNVWIEGSINNSHVTIAAAEITSGSGARNIYIGKDITYTNNDGRDIIGIIAQNDIEIIQPSNDVLKIDAALLAQNGRVGRANYGTSDHRSAITVNGAIATNKRYGFAWISGTTSWGYTTRNVYYDNNLLYFPPPYFPTGTRYLMDLWEEL